MTTLSPGMWASNASRLCECWLPDERPAPNCVRTVSAISAAPPRAQDEVADRGDVGLGEMSGRLDRLVQLAGDRRFQRHDLLGTDPGGLESSRMQDDRVARLPVFELVGRAVSLRVSFVMTVPAVGGGLDDRRAA